MEEISKYIDILEERNKTYKRLFELCLKDISDLESRIEILESKVYVLELNDPPFTE